MLMNNLVRTGSATENENLCNVPNQIVNAPTPALHDLIWKVSFSVASPDSFQVIY